MKSVFISYSWDGKEHQDWVLNLANILITEFGINVILDQYELSAGKDMTHFMERSIEEADKVVIILTENYKQKADNRKKGVGYETSMMTQEIYESPISNIKFIPVLRSGNTNTSSPKYLKSKLYVDMKNDISFNASIHELVLAINDKSKIEKPQLGTPPDLESIEIDPIVHMAESITKKENSNHQLNEIIHSAKGVELYEMVSKKLKQQLSQKVKYYNEKTKIQFFCETKETYCCISSGGYSVTLAMQNRFFNSASDAFLKVIYWNGVHPMGRMFENPPEQAKELEYKFDLNYKVEVVWRNGSEEYGLEKIIQKAFLFLMNKIIGNKSQNFRRD